jgi:hypothetical protein
MSQAVRRRPLNAEVRILSQVNPCEIRDGRSDAARGFPQSTCLYAGFQQCSILILIYTLLLPDEKTGEAWKISVSNSRASLSDLTEYAGGNFIFLAGPHEAGRP